MNDRLLLSVLRGLAGALVLAPAAMAQAPQIGGVVNAANFRQPASPGSLISIFGENLATGQSQAQLVPLPTQLLSTMVYINGILAPLTFVSPGQVNAQVPYEIPPNSSASILVQVNTVNSSNSTLTVVAIAPAIFSQTGTGAGLGAILNTDYSVVTPSTPAQPGETIQIFGTGFGATVPAVATGAGGNGQPLAQTPNVTIGGQNATVTFAGAAPGFAGVDQINAIVPSLAAGNPTIVISLGGAATAANITLAVGSGGSTTNAIPPTYFGMHLAPQFYKGTLSWPTIPFGAVRLLGDDLTWADLEPTQGVFKWDALDAVLAGAASHGVTDILQTLTKTPTWASSNTTDASCADFLKRTGGCYAPKDLNADGTGANQFWKDYVTAIVQHVCTPGPCKIQNWEMWNEPNAKNFWKGTTPQLVRLTKDASQIIKSINPNLVVISPPPAGGGDPMSSAASFTQLFLQDGGGSSIDVIGFHGYLLPAQVGTPELVSAGIGALIQTRTGQNLPDKPLWDTEGSWGLTTNLPDQDQQSAFLARYYLLQATYVQRFYWYAYDYPSGTLWDATTKTLLQPGYAYAQVYNWMVGAAPTGPCTNSGSLYSCAFTRTGGYQALAVWDSALSCNSGVCSTTGYSVPAGFTQYRDLTGATTAVPSNSQIQIGIKPVLLENHNP